MSTSSTSGGEPPELSSAVAVVPAVAALPTVGQHGVVVTFDATQEDWSDYTERSGHIEQHNRRAEATRHSSEYSYVLPTEDIGIAVEPYRLVVQRCRYMGKQPEAFTYR